MFTKLPRGSSHAFGDSSVPVCVSQRQQSAAAAFSGNPGIRFEYTVLSNIYSGGGLPPLEAGSVILEKAAQILSHGAAGNRLTALLKEDAG